MTVRKRYFVKESGAVRDVSEYVYDRRDLDKYGKPPGWFLPQIIHEPEPDDVEFDHIPTDIERRIAFAKKSEEKRNGESDQKQ